MTSTSDKLPGSRVEPVANWDQEIEPSPRRSPTPPPPAWRDRTYWRWALAVLVVLVLAVVLLREPLATWFWPDTRVHRLLSEGEAALLAGHLSAADGSGARQRFEAAQALDSDRVEARAGLARVAAAALDQAEAMPPSKWSRLNATEARPFVGRIPIIHWPMPKAMFGKRMSTPQLS